MLLYLFQYSLVSRATAIKLITNVLFKVISSQLIVFQFIFWILYFVWFHSLFSLSFMLVHISCDHILSRFMKFSFDIYFLCFECLFRTSNSFLPFLIHDLFLINLVSLPIHIAFKRLIFHFLLLILLS